MGFPIFLSPDQFSGIFEAKKNDYLINFLTFLPKTRNNVWISEFLYQSTYDQFSSMSKNWRGIHRIYRKKLRFNAYFNQNPILKNSKTEKMTKFHNKNHKKNQTWYKWIFARPLYSKCGYPKFVEFESIFMKRSKSILKICNTWFIIV